MGSDPINQLDRVVSTQILGAILLGKFTGDLASIYLQGWFGTPDGLLAGMVAGLAFMLFWPSVERTYKNWQRDLWGSEEDQNGSD